MLWLYPSIVNSSEDFALPNLPMTLNMFVKAGTLSIFYRMNMLNIFSAIILFELSPATISYSFIGESNASKPISGNIH